MANDLLLAEVTALKKRTQDFEALQERLESIAAEKRTISSQQWNLDDELESVSKRNKRDNGNLQFFVREAAQNEREEARDAATVQKLESELEQINYESEQMSAVLGEGAPVDEIARSVTALSQRVATTRAAVEAQLRARDVGLGRGGSAYGETQERELRSAIAQESERFAALAREREAEVQALRAQLASGGSAAAATAPPPSRTAEWDRPPPQQRRPMQQRQRQPQAQAATRSRQPMSPLRQSAAAGGAPPLSPSRQLTRSQMALTQLQSELMSLDTVANRRTNAGRNRLAQVTEQIAHVKRDVSRLKILEARIA